MVGFWLFPTLKLFIALAIFVRMRSMYFIIAGLLFCGMAMLYEFSLLGFDRAKNKALFTENGRFNTCIYKQMADEGVRNKKELQKLTCIRATDLDALHGMDSLQELRITKVDMINLDELPNLPNLKHLTLERLRELSDFGGLAKFPKLETC